MWLNYILMYDLNAEFNVDNMMTRFSRLLAEYSSFQMKVKQRMTKLESSSDNNSQQHQQQQPLINNNDNETNHQ